MGKKHKNFVVFLDVDGVLNTRTTVQQTPKKDIRELTMRAWRFWQRQSASLAERISFCHLTGRN